MTIQSKNWRLYQEEAATFFREQGCSTEVEAKVIGVRTKHKIDVWVTFSRYGLECKWVIECKLWNKRVSKEKVNALKTTVEDIGADRGIIICEKGFQSGALQAARGTNITLIPSFEEFKKTAKTDLNTLKLIPDNTSSIPISQLYCFPLDNGPNSLLYKNDILFVGNQQGSNIAFINPLNKTILDTVELDNYELAPSRGAKSKREIGRYPPGNMTVADGKLFVGQVFSDFILVIDIETRSVIRRIFIPGGGEGILASSPDGNKVYFSSNKISKFFIIDSSTYKFEAIPYPGSGRGASSILAHPNGQKLYVGIQRGGQLRGKTYSGGNSFLAVYNLQNGLYESEIYLAEITDETSDDGMPICLTLDTENDLLYIGMFQSRKGIYCLDTKENRIVNNITFEPNSHNKYFEWVDPLAQAIYKEYLLSVNRNNYELVILKKESRNEVRTIPLTEALNGPRDIVIIGDEAIISYPKRNGLIFVDLVKATDTKKLI